MASTVINPIPEYCNKFLYPLVGNTMIELGCKQTKDISYKSYFESIGIKHISIDWNGLFGSLPLDLRKPIALPPADMVTNFGCTEHVEDNQEGVWCNIHNFVKVGGIFISMCPIEGDWWWHGEWYPRKEFYELFAENGYRIDYMEVGREYPTRNLDVRMTKIAHKPFIMPPMETMYFNKRRPR